MYTLALILAGPLGVAYAQAPAPPASAPPATTAAAPAGKTVDQTASPEIVGPLATELGITPDQAQGAAATMFGVAKGRLAPADFAKVAAAVPNMDGLLAAAPPAAAKSAVEAVAAEAGGAGSMIAAAGTLSKLGLKPETIVKVAPALVKVVQSRGGAEVGALLAGAPQVEPPRPAGS